MTTSAGHSRGGTAFVAAALVVVVACTVLLLRAPAHAAALGDVVLAGEEPAGGRGTFVLVAQAEDCEDNLRFLTLLERPTLRRTTRGIGLFMGSAEEYARWEDRLRESGVRWRRASRGELDALAALGHRSTPFWVLLDTNGGVRLSGGAPRGPEDHLALGRLLELAAADASGIPAAEEPR